MRVLIVEPSKTYRHVLSGLFSDAGFEAIEVGTGEEGLSSGEQEKFDLICSSYLLPDMSGIDFTRKLRKNGRQQLPIILPTSEEDTGVLIKALRAGITETFPKSNLVELEEFINDFQESSQSKSSGLNGRILYVEDSRSAAHVVQKYLTKHGLEMDHFPDAEQALRAFDPEKHDLVLTDVILSGPMSGLSLARAIRRMGDTKRNIPILAMSGEDDVSRKIELLRGGVNDYVSKPVVEEELLVRVRNLIENKQLLDQVERQRKRLKELAHTDQLTSLLNRHCIVDIVPTLISETAERKKRLSVIIVDIDHFKTINDQHGHSTGDVVLAETARLLKESCREEDLAIRFGGEEFVIILPDCDSKEAQRRAQSLRKAFIDLKPEGIPITASFGVTTATAKQLSDFNTLFEVADKAVYTAKENGRNRVVYMPIV